MINKLDKIVLDYIISNPNVSSSYIYSNINTDKTLITIKRRLSKLVDKQLIKKSGQAKATKYSISDHYSIIRNIDIDEYFKTEIEDRNIIKGFNFRLLNEISSVNIFSKEELELLESTHKRYIKNISTISSTLYKKDLERLGIDLSWKSSQIEGNTYSLLETEQLFKEKIEAKGKKKEDAVMLLNHKVALDYILDSTNYYLLLSTKKIIEVHSLLIRELGVSTDIRNRIIGITGTNYRPLDNEYQIKEALEQICSIVNSNSNVFEKSFLLLILLSYLQAFEDGNKRTARIMTNAILISQNHCPLSYRTIDPIEYKKAMLIFYEQNNISAMKKIFIDQYIFAVNNYFL